MVRLTWKHGFLCMAGWLGKGDETIEQFSTSSLGNVSPLLWRVPTFLWAAVVTIWSLAMFKSATGKFFLYMTHWGLLFVLFESLFGIIVAVKKPLEKSDATFGLPWYVKTYWVLYNITIPVAFLITVFYWGILRNYVDKINYAPNRVLDVMVHGVNSAVMVIELVSSAHPSRVLHVMQPLYFAGFYTLFTIVYYFAGGVDPWGNQFIYPVMDWSKPEQTMVMVTVTAVFLALLHLVTVGIAKLRDVIARRRLGDSAGVYNDGFDA